MSENRFKMLTKSKPEFAKKFFAQAAIDAERRWRLYQFMAQRDMKAPNGQPATPKPATTVDQQP
jgi:pyruvate-ferredoxin/flavodoxin oxidoreductase